MYVAKLLLLVLFGMVLLNSARTHADEFSTTDAEKGVVNRFLLMGMDGMRDQMIRSGTPEEEVDHAIQTALETYASCYIKVATEQARAQNLDHEVVLKFIAGRPIEAGEQQTIVDLDMEALRLRNASCQKKFLRDTR
ncbi:MAG: hypothetical protein EX272_01420 [Chromatiales bacterium]|nr:MAG: hypothetical protein EX272_01420 [Chromatiales bacterium]